MSGALAIPWKDARLAATVAVPAAATVVGVAALCVFGHTIPGLTDVFERSGGRLPSLAVRVQPVVALLVIASFVVPCWCAVAVALGDSSRHAALLATTAPATDFAKVLSKVGTILATASIVCIALALAMFVAIEDPMVAEWASTDLSRDFLAQLVLVARCGPVFAMVGAMSGLSAVALTRRFAPALAFATLLPLVGVGLAAAGAYTLIGPWWFDADFATEKARWLWHFDRPRATALVLGAFVANGVLMAGIGWRAIPVLAGRAPGKIRLKSVAWALVASALAVGLLAAGVALTDPVITGLRNERASQLHERAQYRAMTCAQLANATAQFFENEPFYTPMSRGQSPWARQGRPQGLEPSSGALQGREYSWSELNDEIRRRMGQGSDQATLNWMQAEMGRVAGNDQLGILQRIRAARWVIGDAHLRVLARLLHRSMSEEEEVAWIVEMAIAGHRQLPEVDGVLDWPGTVSAARGTLLAALSRPARFALPAGDRELYRKELARIGRPLPNAAARLEEYCSPSNKEEFADLIAALRRGVPEEDTK